MYQIIVDELGQFGLTRIVMGLADEVQKAHSLHYDAVRIIMSDKDSKVSPMDDVGVMVENELNRRQGFFVYTFIVVAGSMAFDVTRHSFDDSTIEDRPPRS